MRRRMMTAALVLTLSAVAGTVAYALINPNFTPGNLVDKADLILVLKIKPPEGEGGRCTTEIVRCIKGKMPANAQVIDLDRTVNQEHAKAIRQMLVAQQGAPALLFVGKGERDEPLALMHVGGKWITLRKPETAAPKPRT